MERRGRIHTRLHILRAERRWSQQEVAKRLGVSRQTIVAIEAERYNPTLLLAYQIAELFDCTLDEIFSYEPEVNNKRNQE